MSLQGTRVAPEARREHDASVARLADELRAARSPRLRKRTSNLFRPRGSGARGLDVAGLARVLSVDPDRREADVEGMTTYEDLVRATLPHGLMPLCHSSRPSRWAAPWPDSASSRRRSAAACRTSR